MYIYRKRWPTHPCPRFAMIHTNTHAAASSFYDPHLNHMPPPANTLRISERAEHRSKAYPPGSGWSIYFICNCDVRVPMCHIHHEAYILIIPPCASLASVAGCEYRSFYRSLCVCVYVCSVNYMHPKLIVATARLHPPCY